MLKLRKILLCSYLYYILLALSIIYVFIYINKYVPPKIYNISERNFYVKIISIKTDGDKLTLNLKGKEQLIGNYYFKTEEEKNKFIDVYKLGDYIEVVGNLKLPTNNTIPNTFNYKNYLKSKKINYILNIESYKKIKSNKNIFLKLKNIMYDRIYKIEDNEYLYAFILGNGSYIDSEYYNSFRINGITHLFALSGSQVILISDILSIMLKRLKVNEKLSFIITSFFVILFTFIASFASSLLRATITFILTSLNKIYYTFIKSKYLLYLTFIIMVIYNPFYIYDLGFILSFTITFFLIIIGENITLKNKIFSSVFTSFISFLASTPILINNFYEINTIGFINNLFFIPYVTYIVFPLSILTYVFKSLSPFLKFFTNIMEKISYLSSTLFSFNIYFVEMSLLVILIYYIILINIIKKKKIFLIIFFILILVFSYHKQNLDKNTYLYFIDVGQGDSILIRTKNNKSIMIDTGGKAEYEKEKWQLKNNNFNLMENTIIPFIKSKGIKKLDYLILTHGDADHSGNAPNLKNNFMIDTIYINKGKINYLENKVTNNILLDSYLKIDNVELYSLNDVIYEDENQNSIILLLKIYNYKILLMADASKLNEKDIISKYNLQNIDILKLGHHGSNTSTSEEFIVYTNPKECIVSASLNNKYNHPSPQTVKLLNDYNIKFYETSKNGTIEYIINEHRFITNTYSP